jgi:hypothetical protein
MSREEAAAVIAMKLELSDGIVDSCTGTVVSSEQVVTAAHCFDEGIRKVEIDGRTWRRGTSSEFQVQSSTSSDVAVVTLPGLNWASALPILREDAGSLLEQKVELGGAGLREDGTYGAVEFLVAEVTMVDDLSIHVDASRGGPCNGDSGGPLLLRDGSGSVALAGVLSAGSPTCSGPDRYARLDVNDAWLMGEIGETVGGSVACGGIGTEGRCFGRRAVWCENGKIRAQDCQDGSACGWREQHDGYRCGPSHEDACSGVADTGTCEGEVAVRCNRGELEFVVCISCGGVCQVSPRSGKVVCVKEEY